jgi:hypothetical protein
VHYINGHVVIFGEIKWQADEFFNRNYSNDSARIAIHFTATREVPNHELMKQYEDVLSKNKITWITKSPDGWHIDPAGLKAIYPNLPDVLLNLGNVKVLPDIETKENQNFGGKTFVQSVAMYLDPEETKATNSNLKGLPIEIVES